MAITETGPNLWSLDDPNYFGRDLVILSQRHNIDHFQVGYGVSWRLDSNYNGQRDVLDGYGIRYFHLLDMNGMDVARLGAVTFDFGRGLGTVDRGREGMTGVTRGGVMDAPLRPSRMYMDRQHWEDIVNFSLESQQVEAVIQEALKGTLPEPRTCWDRLDDDL